MKGFPNQVAGLLTLTKALRVIADLLAAGKNPKDDGVYGEALIRTYVLRTTTGNSPVPVDQYLADQKAKSKSNQSFRTRARGLREFFRVLGLIVDSGVVGLSSTGRQIAALGDAGTSYEWLRAWRTAILNMTHDGGDGTSSHPYQVLLRLVANHPGITRAKCALALEAKDDSEDELARITALSHLSESTILRTIGETQSNWDNAKKILPHFAEELGDVRKDGQNFYLAPSPGATGGARTETGTTETAVTTVRAAPRRPSAVTAQTIATKRTLEEWDEVIDEPPAKTAQAERDRKNKLTDRFNRHQAIVQKAADTLAGAEIFENPFDCFARFATNALLIEVKSLNGTHTDETDRVREALAQLLYYEAFATVDLLAGRRLRKIACFEQQISDAHVAWLEASNIRAIWCEGDGFMASPIAKADLSGYFGF